MQLDILRVIGRRCDAGFGADSGARYFFHVKNGSLYRDETGSVFPSDRQAVAHATVLASELAQDEDWDDFMIVVTDADGRVIARIPARK